MHRSVRPTIALFMTAIYLLVVLAPLAPAVLHSPALAHALTGECSGDCGTCGCAPERSAARACCCWQKKLSRERRPMIAVTSGHCSKSPPPAATAGCCKTPAPLAATAGCCSSGSTTPVIADSVPAPATETSGETVITATPCGSAKMLALASTEKIQHLPFTFSSRPPCQQPLAGSPPLTDRLTSQPVEPPDPPPKISARS